MQDENVNGGVFAVVGGDLRQARLAGALSEAGYRVFGLLFDMDVGISGGVERTDDLEAALRESDTVIFPLPMTLDGRTVNSVLSKREVSLAECVKSAQRGALLLGGLVPDDFRALAAKKGLEVEDYAARDEFAVLNAVPTAEGAAAIAMAERPRVLRGSRCLVAGFGRVGRELAALLRAMGAQVWVAARKPRDLAAIKCGGMMPVAFSELSGSAGGFDIVFNTVPAPIFGEDFLKALHEECLLIDLASKPGGVDFEAAKRLGVRVIWALSLPGKVAPITAGEIIKDTVLNILKERRG